MKIYKRSGQLWITSFIYLRSLLTLLCDLIVKEVTNNEDQFNSVDHKVIQCQKISSSFTFSIFNDLSLLLFIILPLSHIFPRFASSLAPINKALEKKHFVEKTLKKK